jgi:CBS domain-containing protein
LKIREITLFIFGGVSELEEEPGNPSLELKIALAGPLTSVALAIGLGALWWLSVLVKLSPLIQAPLNYAAVVNEIVALFNLIPAFPMDGGRVLRSVIWKRNGDLLRATRLATIVGRAIAYVLMFSGLFFILAVNFFSGLWLIIIGWFISSGARGAFTQTVIEEELGKYTAAEIMTRKVDSVSPDSTLEELSQEFSRLKHNGFPVISGGSLQGCVTTGDLRKIKKESWSSSYVKDIMTPREKLQTLREGERATRAALLMSNYSIGRVFVLNETGELVGIITRSDVLRTVQFSQFTLAPGRGGRWEGTSFTVELGMNFVLEQPVVPDMDWIADFDAEKTSLVSEQRIKHADGRDFKQFVFHASGSGIQVIILLLEKSGLPEAERDRKATARAKYTITVTEDRREPSSAKV